MRQVRKVIFQSCLGELFIWGCEGSVFKMKVTFPRLLWIKEILQIIEGLCIDGLMQERCNSITNALELHLSCTNPSVCLSMLRCQLLWWWANTLQFNTCIAGGLYRFVRSVAWGSWGQADRLGEFRTRKDRWLMCCGHGCKVRKSSFKHNSKTKSR